MALKQLAQSSVTIVENCIVLIKNIIKQINSKENDIRFGYIQHRRVQISITSYQYNTSDHKSLGRRRKHEFLRNTEIFCKSSFVTHDVNKFSCVIY